MVDDHERCCAQEGGRANPPERCCRKRRPAPSVGGLVEPAALAALLRADGHGYDLRRDIAELTDGRVEADPGGLYRTLRRLEDDGFVTSIWVEGESGPQRREYQLTNEGRVLAQEWVANLRERQRLNELLVEALSATGDGDSQSPDSDLAGTI
jgi:PadR family transcriptional regulator, regulatory protein PadR